jgi:polar amino acid transport system substrate-binding protein
VIQRPVAEAVSHTSESFIPRTIWLNGTSSGGCRASAESRYFGEGIGIAVKHGNDTLRRAINDAVFWIWDTGRFTDLRLRYFPISPF